MKFRKTLFQKQYFILLLPVFFVLHGFMNYYPLIFVNDSLILLLKYLLAIAIFAGLFFLIVRSWRTVFVLSALVMCFHFFFGATHDWLKSWLADSFIVKYSFLIPAAFIVLILLLVYGRRKKPAFLNLSTYLNALFFLLILIDLIQLCFKI